MSSGGIGNGPEDEDKEFYRLLLQFVMIFIFEEQKGYDRPWKYARALEAFFAEGSDPVLVPRYIEDNGGIYALVRKAAKERPLRVNRARDT